MTPDRDDEVAALLRGTLGEARVPDAARREIVHGALERVRTPPRTLRLALAYAGAMAALVVAVLVMHRRPEPRATPIAKQEAEVWQADATPQVHETDGHRIDVEPGARVRAERMEPHRHVFALDSGRASFRVEKLQKDELFRVRSAHMELQVVGTQFTVQADEHCTVVSVREGRVWVRPVADEPVTLAAGDTRLFCREAGPEQQQPGDELVREALGILSSGDDFAAAEALLQRYLREHPQGHREEEARFQLWLLASREGATAIAIDRAQQLRARFPASTHGQRVDQWLRTHGGDQERAHATDGK